MCPVEIGGNKKKSVMWTLGSAQLPCIVAGNLTWHFQHEKKVAIKLERYNMCGSREENVNSNHM